MKKVTVFDYNSLFLGSIKEMLRLYNDLNSKDALSVTVCKSTDCTSESMAGPADIIIHSGGDGVPVKEDAKNVSRLYICHSHQWKARQEGGEVVRLKKIIKGVQPVDVLEDDEILGKKGKMPIMQYHTFAVTRPPHSAKVLATSKVQDAEGKEIEIIEALKYPDGSVSIQGHPEEGTAKHIVHNFLKNMGDKNETF